MGSRCGKLVPNHAVSLQRESLLEPHPQPTQPDFPRTRHWFASLSSLNLHHPTNKLKLKNDIGVCTLSARIVLVFSQHRSSALMALRIPTGETTQPS